MDYADFGRYLTQQRELRGVKLDEVSRLTRIPLTLLIALEGGQVERLPGRVFVVNYIKAYAGAIGLAAEEALLRFEEIDAEPGAAPAPEVGDRRRRARVWLALGIGLLLLVLGGAVLARLGRLPLPRAR